MSGIEFGEGKRKAVLNPFECYSQYIALKRHFTSDYDYFKYQGKVNASETSFEVRKDKYFFYKLSKKKSPADILLANMLVNPKMWIGEILSEKGNHNYNEWRKRQESLFYDFHNLVKNLLDKHNDLRYYLEIPEKGYPVLYNLYDQGFVSSEQMIILNSIIKFIPKWNEHITEDVLYPMTILKLKNYAPFVNIDRVKYREKLLEIIEDYSDSEEISV